MEGSVKRLLEGDILGGNIYRPPTFDRLGLGAWLFKRTFSVADLKWLIPECVIRQKDYVLAMTSAMYWRAAAEAGFDSAYVGMLDADGQITDVQALLDRGDMSNIMVMNLAITPHDLVGEGEITNEIRSAYHQLISTGQLSTYVADIECIFRWGFPLGSSTFQKICQAAGLGAEYERVATYTDTVDLLDQVRAIPGILDKPEMRAVLAAADLKTIPNPGRLLTKPALNFDTKFARGGDEPYSFAEAQTAMHLDDLRWTSWKSRVTENAHHQHNYGPPRGISVIDGKTEAMVSAGAARFTDTTCNPDECRTMIKYNGVLLPSNKEIQRAKFRKAGIYAAIKAAKATYGEDWRKHLTPEFIAMSVIETATAESVALMELALGEVGNRLLGVDCFDAQPIESWADQFLPYASHPDA